MGAQLFNGKVIKQLMSDEVNYIFDKRNGTHATWGATPEEDATHSPYGPFILDMEVGTVCHGPATGPCSFCYKGNTPRGEYMSFETFKAIFDKVPQVLTQVAFGIGDVDGVPDLWRMFDYCRNNDHNPGVVPNVTVNGARLTDEIVAKLAHHCGAVAVSLYDEDSCFDAVERISKAGIKQTNIHAVLCEETYDRCRDVVEKAATDPRLKGHLRAIVFLTLKPKGPRNSFTTIKDVSKYRALVERAMELDVGVGFDSCSAPTFLASIKGDPKFEQIAELAESCESTKFSFYCNVEGKFFPCSFTEGEPGFEGIDVLAATDFLKDVWNHPETVGFRERLLNQGESKVHKSCQLCPMFALYDPDVVGCAEGAKPCPGGSPITFVERSAP